MRIQKLPVCTRTVLQALLSTLLSSPCRLHLLEVSPWGEHNAWCFCEPGGESRGQERKYTVKLMDVKVLSRQSNPERIIMVYSDAQRNDSVERSPVKEPSNTCSEPVIWWNG
jgi:hypothetical protein